MSGKRWARAMATGMKRWRRFASGTCAVSATCGCRSIIPSVFWPAPTVAANQRSCSHVRAPIRFRAAARENSYPARCSRISSIGSNRSFRTPPCAPRSSSITSTTASGCPCYGGVASHGAGASWAARAALSRYGTSICVRWPTSPTHPRYAASCNSPESNCRPARSARRC